MGSPTDEAPMLGRMLRHRNIDARVRKAAASASRSVSRNRGSLARVERLDPRTLLSAGALDPSFGGTGLETQDFGFGDDTGYAVTVQSDGRILVAGTVRGSNGST